MFNTLSKQPRLNLLKHTSYSIKHTSQKMFSGFRFRKSKHKDLSSKYFFLISTDSAHSIKISLIVIIVLHATQTRGFSFFKVKNASEKSDQYVICLQLCLLSLSFKMIIHCTQALLKSQSLLDTFFLPNLMYVFGSQGF